MSGINAGKTPRTDSEYIRDLVRRITALEQAKAVRIGSWAVNEVAGELVATKPGRSVVLTTTAASTLTVPGHTIRVLTIVGAPTGGMLTLIYKNQPTTGIAPSATADDVLGALLALSPKYTVLDFDVTGPDGSPWTITTPIGSLDVDSSLLTGGSGVSVAITAPA